MLSPTARAAAAGRPSSSRRAMNPATTCGISSSAEDPTSWSRSEVSSTIPSRSQTPSWVRLRPIAPDSTTPASLLNRSRTGGRPAEVGSRSSSTPSTTSPESSRAPILAATAVRERPVTRPTSLRVSARPSRTREKTSPVVAGPSPADMRVIQPPVPARNRSPFTIMYSERHNLVLHADITPPTVRARPRFPQDASPMSPLPDPGAHPGAQPVPPPVPAADFVVFGGTGDLAARKLLPALYLRDRDGQLTAETRIIALSRAGLDDAGYRDKIRGELSRFVSTGELDEVVVQRFVARLSHVSIDIEHEAGWPELVATLADVDRIRVFYLAIGPALFGPVSRRLAEHGLVTESSRLVLEKPIGHDLASAQGINDAVGAVFEEHQIFRIDHYLGKESVQNLLVTRFANTFLEPPWNANCIDHVQITAAESLGVGSRGGYYDESGALRDMVQNHLLQLLCLVAMEPPTYVGKENVRDEKLKVLQALKPITGDAVDQAVVAGQYTAGLVDGQVAASYQSDIDTPGSTTETFVAIKAE